MKVNRSSYPQFGPAAEQFILQTDASATDIGAVLEQGGRVVGYASRILSSAEKNHSVIQRECLAIIFSPKKFNIIYWDASFHCSLITPLAVAIESENVGTTSKMGTGFSRVQFNYCPS